MTDEELIREISTKAFRDVLEARSQELAEDIAGRMKAALQPPPASRERTKALRDGSILIAGSRTQTETLEALLAASSAITEGCGLMILRGTQAGGWSCHGLTPLENFKRAVLDCSSGVAAKAIASCTATETRASELDPIFVVRLRLDDSAKVVLIPVLLKGHVAALLFALTPEGDETAALEVLVQVAQLALDVQAYRKAPQPKPAVEAQPAAPPPAPAPATPVHAAPEAPVRHAEPPDPHSTLAVAAGEAPVPQPAREEEPTAEATAAAESSAPKPEAEPAVPEAAVAPIETHQSVAPGSEAAYVPATSQPEPAYVPMQTSLQSPPPQIYLPAQRESAADAAPAAPQSEPSVTYAPAPGTPVVREAPSPQPVYVPVAMPSVTESPAPSQAPVAPTYSAPVSYAPPYGVASMQPATATPDPSHEKARRFAKLLVEEIKLYNQSKVAEGRLRGDLYSRLREDIEKSRAAYHKRYGETVRDVDYFTQELMRILADNNPSVMGAGFPG